MSRHGFVGLGYISGIHGIRGWVKVFSYTQPREQILEYPLWHISAEKTLDSPDAEAALTATRLESGRMQGKGIVAKLAGVEDRDAAAALIDFGIFVPRAQLPDTEPGQYYWADLAGLSVCDSAGRMLGVVDHLMETGGHDVLVLDGGAHRMIPFVPGKVVLDVDPERGLITVDWDAAWWE
jgi:16S rRNA processing protein RimM